MQRLERRNYSDFAKWADSLMKSATALEPKVKAIESGFIPKLEKRAKIESRAGSTFEFNTPGRLDNNIRRVIDVDIRGCRRFFEGFTERLSKAVGEVTSDLRMSIDAQGWSEGRIEAGQRAVSKHIEDRMEVVSHHLDFFGENVARAKTYDELLGTLKHMELVFELVLGDLDKIRPVTLTLLRDE